MSLQCLPTINKIFSDKDKILIKTHKYFYFIYLFDSDHKGPYANTHKIHTRSTVKNKIKKYKNNDNNNKSS